MIPVSVLSSRPGPLLAGDLTTLAEAGGVYVGLIIAPFAPSNNLVFADLTVTAIAGLGPILNTPGVQIESVDPLTGELIVELNPIVGGYHWETQPGFVGPVTVYGFAMFSLVTGFLYASEALPLPVLLNAPNQSIDHASFGVRIDRTRFH